MITPCVAIFSISKTIRFPVSFMKAIIAFILPEVKMGEKVVLKFFQVSPDAMVIWCTRIWSTLLGAMLIFFTSPGLVRSWKEPKSFTMIVLASSGSWTRSIGLRKKYPPSTGAKFVSLAVLIIPSITDSVLSITKARDPKGNLGSITSMSQARSPCLLFLKLPFFHNDLLRDWLARQDNMQVLSFGS